MSFKKQKQIRVMVLLASGVFLGLVLIASSCFEGGPYFSHKKHVEEQSLTCDTCHTGSPDGVQAGMPSTDTCATCHEEAKLYADIAAEFQKKWPRFKALTPDGIFSHKSHVDYGVGCENCHNGISKSTKVTETYMPTMDTCTTCHKEQGISTDCETCHKELSPTVPPPDHRQAWTATHGESAREPETGERCFWCHNRTTCDTCHKVEKPADHNQAWREFAHGVETQLDRNRCATCHRSDFCITCHKETPPRSHRAGWGPPSSRHCLECHVGVEVTCSVCHGAEIQHLSAPVRPAGPVHATATDCRTCHTGFLLIHPDNGENCLSCHR